MERYLVINLFMMLIFILYLNVRWESEKGIEWGISGKVIYYVWIIGLYVFFLYESNLS